MNTAPVSPLGQRFYVKTKYATASARPRRWRSIRCERRFPRMKRQPPASVLRIPLRDGSGRRIGGDRRSEPEEQEPGVLTLLDGDPANNFLEAGLAFNPGGVLNGARRITHRGNLRLHSVQQRTGGGRHLANPLAPKSHGADRRAGSGRSAGRGRAVPLRFCGGQGRTEGSGHDQSRASAKWCPALGVPLTDARNIYVARTYAYVAGGKQGLVIVDVEKPEHPSSIRSSRRAAKSTTRAT